MAHRGKARQSRDRERDETKPKRTPVAGKELKINQWDTSAVKNALDDAAKKVKDWLLYSVTLLKDLGAA